VKGKEKTRKENEKLSRICLSLSLEACFANDNFQNSNFARLT